MLEIHELLGREVDPIDDLRHKFETCYTEDYHNPANGDWISDDYWTIIDLTTKPGKLTEHEIARLNQSISRLNDKYKLIQERLCTMSLLAAYVDVAKQVTAINNSRDPQTPIVSMHGAPQDAISEICGWISNGNNLLSRSWNVMISGQSDRTGVSSESYYTEAQRCFDIAAQLGGVSIKSEGYTQVAAC